MTTVLTSATLQYIVKKLLHSSHQIKVFLGGGINLLAPYLENRC